MAKRPVLFSIIGILTMFSSLMADGTGEIVRIPTPITPRCINAKTDEVTMTMRRIITQKTAGFFTSDNRAGVTVISTLNSDGNPQAKFPSVNLISIESAPKGQVSLPLEYPIASLLPLSSDAGKTFTKNMLLELYLDKTRGANTFGKILDAAGSLLGKLPIPSNPYLDAANVVLKFANDTITNESKDAGGQLFASVTLQFNDRDESDTQQCLAGDHQLTGAIAVVGSKGVQGSTPLPLGNLSNKYCWRYVVNNTYEVQYANKPAGGCQGIPDSAFNEVPNDYTMILLAAATLPPPNHNLAFTTRRTRDLQESKKLCAAMKLAPSFCGVK